MELFIPHTPLAIVITALLSLVVCLKIVKDAKEIRASRQTHNSIMNFVKKKNVPRIGVVIELTRVADTIMPLLDQLYEQDYKGMEVTVVVKHTAGKYAQSKLLYYRRKYQRKNLKIVKHSKGINTTELIRRHISSEFVVQLTPNKTLSTDFFSGIALYLLNDQVDAFIPRRHIATGRTVLSALGTTFGVWQHVLATFYTPKLTENNLVAGRIYRREALLEGAKLTTMYASRVAVYEQAQTSWKTMPQAATAVIGRALHDTRMRIGTISAVIIVAGLTAYIWNEDVLLLAGFIVALYWAVYGMSLLELKGYSFSERINLLLFAPFSLLLSILLVLFSFLATMYSRSGLRKLSLRRLGARGKRRSQPY